MKENFLPISAAIIILLLSVVYAISSIAKSAEITESTAVSEATSDAALCTDETTEADENNNKTMSLMPIYIPATGNFIYIPIYN